MGFGDKKETLIEKKIKENENPLDNIDMADVYKNKRMKKTKDSSEEVRTKKIFFVSGEKNSGKTVVTYGVLEDGDTALVLSFDNKSARPLDAKEGLKFLRDSSIEIDIFNASEYYNILDASSMLATAKTTYFYVTQILRDYADPDNEDAKINGKNPDWVIIDGTERMTAIMEMYMRQKNGLQPNSGVPQNCWKDRRIFLDSIHDLSLLAASKGVIYTAYTEVKEIVDNYQVAKRKDVPKWFGKIKEETDVEIRTTAERDGKKPKYFATISGSKLECSYPDGTYDVTGRRLNEVLEEKE